MAIIADIVTFRFSLNIHQKIHKTEVEQLTVIITNSNLSGSSASKALCMSNSQMETADIIRNIWSYLSNYCKTLFIFINIIINNSEELWYCECLRSSWNYNCYRFVTEISNLGEDGEKVMCIIYQSVGRRSM